MRSALIVRPVERADYEAWLPLWEGYNAFYGRAGATALDPAITATSWRRFFEPDEPVFALVAESDGQLVGLAHYLFHRSTTRVEPVCYLQDLFTLSEVRGRGIGRSLIERVYEVATAHACRRVYWQTHGANATARQLYDKLAKHRGFIVDAHDA